MIYQHITVPQAGAKIEVKPDFSLSVPDQPIVAFIEGDGIGVDITPVMRRVIDTAVERAYGGAAKYCMDGDLCWGKGHPRIWREHLAAARNR